jgi:hypothetical protein
MDLFTIRPSTGISRIVRFIKRINRINRIRQETIISFNAPPNLASSTILNRVLAGLIAW